jgi:GGDEF domain-containing protein
LAQLVGQRKISVLPELLEAGNLYCGLVKTRLFDIVAGLQPQVDQLADVLSLDLPGDRDYQRVLAQAHEQMSRVAEDAIAPVVRLSGASEVAESCDDMLQDAQELMAAMQAFLHPARAPISPEMEGNADDSTPRDWSAQHAAHQRTQGEMTTASAQTEPITATDVLLNSIVSAARSCRMRRAELSLLLLEVDGYAQMVAAGNDDDARRLVRACGKACRAEMPEDAEMLRVTPNQIAVVLPSYERRQTIALANEVINRVRDVIDNDQDWHGLGQATLSAGAATATSIPKNFSAEKLSEGALRCLSAARSSGGSAVKSIEVL